MRKNLFLVAIIVFAVVLTGCRDQGGQATPASDLFANVTKRKPLTLKKALAANEKAMAFANSDLGPRDVDSFVLAMSQAQIDENYAAQYEAIALRAEQESQSFGGGSGGSSFDTGSNSVDSYSSGSTSGSASVTGVQASDSTSGSSTASSSSGSSGGSASSSSSSGGGTSSSSGSSSETTSSGATTQEDEDAALLSIIYQDFLDYKANLDPYFEAAGDQSKAAGAPDSDLVGIYYSSQSVIDFVRDHPGVKDGDKALADVGYTMSLTDKYWGLGGYQSATAYTYILLYYPGGDYAAFAEEQLALSAL